MDNDTNPVSESNVENKQREGLSRRRLLKAGAAAVPVMVTIKSVSAEAAGLKATPANWGWDWDKKDDTPGVLSSIGCIQNVEMPWSTDDATKRVCDKSGLDFRSWDRKRWSYHGSVQEGEGGAMPANFQPATDWSGYNYDRDWDSNDRKCQEVYDYFNDGGRRHFWPGCKFDVSRERHNTYVQICLSNACWESIKTATGWGGDAHDFDFKI